MGYKKILLLIFIILLICLAIYLAYKYSSCINWPVVTGITLILTMIAIILYTIETGRLRRATVRHTELSLRPLVVIDWDETEGSKYVLRNMGKGHALKVKVEDISVINEEQIKIAYNFPEQSMIPADKFQHLIIKVGDEEASSFQLGALNPYSAIRSFNYIVKYTDINKKPYRTKGKMGKGGVSVESTE